jgi:stringent starvation protein B
MMQMLSTRPYLIRAFYDWIIDSRLTPYVIIDAEKPGSQLPEDYVENGQIVLNISAMAVRDLSISNDFIEFSAKFNGEAMQVYAPVSSVIAIYAYENGRGMVFSEEEELNEQDGGDDGNGGDDTPPPRPPRGKPKLKVVK